MSTLYKNKELSNLGAHFVVKAVHHLGYCGFGPPRANQARLAKLGGILRGSGQVQRSYLQLLCAKSCPADTQDAWSENVSLPILFFFIY